MGGEKSGYVGDREVQDKDKTEEKGIDEDMAEQKQVRGKKNGDIGEHGEEEEHRSKEDGKDQK